MIAKRIQFGVIAYVTLLITSCSNDFDLVADWQNIPVVYGVLSPQDTAHYIRVERAFLDPNTSALVQAQIPDSIYYTDVQVNLQEISPAGSVIQTVALQKIDGNAEGYPKESGIFADSPNWLYKTKLPLQPANSYKLTVVNAADQTNVQATTPLVGNFDITSPISSYDNESFRLNFEAGKATTIRWKKANNSTFYDIHINILYQETPLANPGAVQNKMLTWKAATSIVPDNLSDVSLTYDLQGDAFFNFLNNNLSKNDDVCRKLVAFDCIVYAGADELQKYLTIGNSSGITSGQEVPKYTNLSQGRGIFTARNADKVTYILPNVAIATYLASSLPALQFITNTQTCN
jgi:hypothetical protein